MVSKKRTQKRDPWIVIHREKGSSYSDTTSAMPIFGLGVLVRVTFSVNSSISESLAFIPMASIVENDEGYFEISLKTSN